MVCLAYCFVNQSHEILGEAPGDPFDVISVARGAREIRN